MTKEDLEKLIWREDNFNLIDTLPHEVGIICGSKNYKDHLMKVEKNIKKQENSDTTMLPLSIEKTLNSTQMFKDC